MTLASLDDVRRMLKDTTVTDDDLQPHLDAATEWVERVYGRDWDATGAQTETFYNVRQGTVIALRDEAPSALTVTGYAAPASAGTVLVANTGYAVLNRGRVQLANILPAWSVLFGIRPEEAELFSPFTWARVVIAYTASASVPTPVRDAVALIAAAWYQRSAQEAGGLKSENLGDYSYTREDSANDGGAAVPKRAETLLAPYGRPLVRSV